MPETNGSAQPKVFFGAGPSSLPEPILDKIIQEFRSIDGTGLSILELSHRSKEYAKINKRAQEGIRKLGGFDDDFAVLLIPGGATLQFSAWLYNVLQRIDCTDSSIDFLISGYWSERAAEEAERLGFQIKRIPVLKKSLDAQGQSRVTVTLPAIETLSKIVYYCQNETIDGVELPELDLGDRIVVCDVSSNIFTRPLNAKRYTILFAGAQKNLGVAGVTIVIAKRSLCVDPAPKAAIPLMMDYAVHDKAESVYNTPPVFAIYVTALMAEWLTFEFGDLHKVDAYSKQKASLLYSLAVGNSVLYAPVEPANFRSRVNVVLKLKGDSHADDDLVKAARAQCFEGIQGHRHSGGGLRVSLYNPITLEQTQSFSEFLKKYLNEM